ncbi:MAG: diguanylate cyclase [Bradymonadaceae bacterium]
MSATTRTFMRQRTQTEAGWPSGLAVLCAVGYVTGFAGNPAWPWWANLLAVVLPASVVVGLSVRSWRRREDVSLTFELERSLLTLIVLMIAVRSLTAFSVDAFALVYLSIALIAALQPARVGGAVLAGALAMEWTSHLMGTWSGQGTVPTALVETTAVIDWHVLGTRTAFMCAFGAFSFVVHGREVLERRRRYRQEVEEEREKMHREAREFRLMHSGRADGPQAHREQAEELIVRDAVDAVHHTVYVSLDLLKTALKCHTCVLLWFDVRNERLSIKELVSDSDAIIEESIEPARGVIGGISRRREPVNLKDIRPGFRGLSYYREPQKVTSFLGVPVIEQGHLRGVLCVDRSTGPSFTEADEHVVREAASFIVRCIENERMFSTIERTRYELGRFFEASRALNDVLTPQDVYRVALECVAQIAPYDFAALTVYDEEADEHTIAVVDGSEHLKADVQGWAGKSFGANRGLVSMVLENRHYLPVGGNLRDPGAVVFTKDEKLSDIKSMLVLPLIVQDKPVGTFVIAHREAGRFSAERREMLEVVGNQVGITLQNATLYARMEEMAKIDALTGLANRRYFQEKLGETMARHKRTGRPFGLVLMDIDHFKPVNDTYGHVVGDEVLREVGRLMRESLREVDVPARYGGEEFVIILEETEIEAGVLVADRLRTELSQLVFQTEKGPLSCTISMGYACGPRDSDDTHQLIDLADQALYHSKENGRNQVTIYRDLVDKEVG